jgi:hypothetical protein
MVKKRGVVEKIERDKSGENDVLKEVERILELANDAYLSWKRADSIERRELVETVTSNLVVEDKTLILKLEYPFEVAPIA